ncbi:MAG: 2-amino-4-hydroxy-6-hydroxymethyldihydropteridine diphosphokinase [Chloroflexi bacterium]|nr:2-amino-4-hydroxy-6-hydroxymethyldihydropteridine diphosphokinase [Chloroflexota bacterium]
MNTVIIALGSNIEKERNLPLALKMLREMCRVTAVAPIYETIPAGLLNQPNFWNTAVLIKTTLTPTQIKQEVIGPIETKLGRVRQADSNAPRTIDLDIVLFNDAVGEYEGGDGRKRLLPDPDLLKFPHLVVPVSDLAPIMPHPLSGETMAHLAERLLAEMSEQMGERPLWEVQIRVF